MRKKCALILLTGVMALTLAAANADLAQAEGNQVFFRGGLAVLSKDRSGEIFTDVVNASGQRNDANSGYYIGAGLDLLMHKNFLGVKGMSLVGELGLEYNRYATRRVTNAISAVGAAVKPQEDVRISQLVIDVAPKLRFREGTGLRPWIIPIGLDFIVNSPPSDQTTYLDAGLQWGAGVEMTVWGPINLGLDARYHVSFQDSTTNNNFGSVGAYLGIGF